MSARRWYGPFLALLIVVGMTVLGVSGVASAKKPVGSPKWCKHHPKSSLCTASDPSFTVSPNPLVLTGEDEIHAVIQLEDEAGADQQVLIDSSQMTNACGSVTFSDLQGVTPPLPPFATLTPATHTNEVTLSLDADGNADVVVSGTNCVPGSYLIEANFLEPWLTGVLATLKVDSPATTTVGVTAEPGSEVETGNTAASGESDVYGVFYVETTSTYANTQVEISDIALETSCLGGWIWEPGNTSSGKSSGNISGNPGNGGSGPGDLKNTATDEPYTMIDGDSNAVFTFMGAECAASSALVPPGSTATATVDFSVAGSPGYTGTFIVAPPGVT